MVSRGLRNKEKQKCPLNHEQRNSLPKTENDGEIKK